MYSIKLSIYLNELQTIKIEALLSAKLLYNCHYQTKERKEKFKTLKAFSFQGILCYYKAKTLPFRQLLIIFHIN